MSAKIKSAIRKSVNRIKAPVANMYHDNRAWKDKVEMIRGSLTCKKGILLDVGCNAGMISAPFASKDLFVIGVDVNDGYLKEAAKRHWGTGACAYIKVGYEEDSLLGLPACDVSFILSVHHAWYRHYSRAQCVKILSQLIGNTRSQCFLQLSTRRDKYGLSGGEFKDNDEESVIAFNKELLAEAGITEDRYNIKLLGSVPEKDQYEPLRPILLIEPKSKA